MDVNCKNCGKCCELDIFVNVQDINRWVDEDRMDILSCLTWQAIATRKPPWLLYIPHKKHIAGHTLLKKLYNEDWAKNNKCIFWNNNKCSIYKTRPMNCVKFPNSNLNWKCNGIVNSIITIDDKNFIELNNRICNAQNLEIFKNREMLSAVINKAKKDVNLKKLLKIIDGVIHEEIQKKSNDR